MLFSSIIAQKSFPKPLSKSCARLHRCIAAKHFTLVENDGEVPSIRVPLHGWSSDEDAWEEDEEAVGVEESEARFSAHDEEEEDWNVEEQPAPTQEKWDIKERPAEEKIPEGDVLAVGERVAPRIEVDWAIRENEENRLAESLRNNDLLLPPPAGYFDDDDDDDDYREFFDMDGERSDDDFDLDFCRRGDDCEYMYSSLGSASRNDTALPLEEKTERITDSGVDLPSLRKGDFPKSTSVEVLHSDGPSSRQTRIEYGVDSTTLCFTGQDRHGGCARLPESLAESPDADSFSLDEPDRAADSGYPNSSSLNQEADVDADLTPEQVDDISRSDGEPSLSEDGSDDEQGAVQARPAAPPPPPPARLPLPPVFGNVENGDLANNNRDGEGNNAAPEADIPGLPLEFAAVVHEEEQQPLLAAAVMEDEDGVLPEDADPFPPWLSNLLGLEHREGTEISGGGAADASLSDTDEGLGEENSASWSGEASAHVSPILL